MGLFSSDKIARDGRRVCCNMTFLAESGAIGTTCYEKRGTEPQTNVLPGCDDLGGLETLLAIEGVEMEDVERMMLHGKECSMGSAEFGLD